MTQVQARYYASGAQPTTLTATLGTTGNPSVAAVTGWPTQFPFVALIDWGNFSAGATQEAVLVSSITGTGPYTLVCTRGYDNTGASSHTNANAPVFHAYVGADFQDMAIQRATNTVSWTGSQTADASSAATYVVSLTGNTTITAISNPPVTGVEASLTFYFSQPSSGTTNYTVTWPSSVTWLAGAAPVINTGASALTVVTLETFDGGTTWYGTGPAPSLPLPVAFGGSGVTNQPPYQAVMGGITSTSPFASQILPAKPPCRVATTGPLPANSYAGGSLTATFNGILPAIDGQTLILNDRLIVMNEATAANNGIYQVRLTGTGTTITNVSGIPAGATSMTVASISGITNGATLRLDANNAGAENVTVTAPPSGSTVTFTACSNSHASGAPVGITAWAFDRVPDMIDTTASTVQVPGATVWVTSGTLYANTQWTVQGPGPFTIGTTAINWQQAGTSRTATVTVGFSGADYLCTGTHDGAVILAAVNSLPASGGRVLIRDSAAPYDFSATADRLFIAKSNVTIEGETYGGVTLKANASLFPGGSTAQGNFGIVTVGKTQTALQSNVTLRNLVIDCNSQVKTGGLALDGGSSLAGQTGLQNVLVEYVTVRNMCQQLPGSSTADLVSGMVVASGTNTPLGNRGYVDRVTYWRCDLGPSANEALMLQGTNITNLRIAECRIHDCQGNGVQVNDYGASITNSDWTVDRCRFENNMITVQAISIAHFRDQTQIGINNFSFTSNYVGPAANPGATGNNAQDFILTPYCAANNKITGNIFDQCGNGISLGRSNAGSEYRSLPLARLLIADNVFYGMRHCFDPDAATFMQLRGNIFYGIKTGPVFSPYSSHWPAVIEDNIFYDCNAADPAAPTDSARSVIRLAGQGFTVRNNHFIDDRALANPSGSLVLSQAAGGSLSSRTYFAQYTWSSGSGETQPSAEQSIALSAGNLITINAGTSGPVQPPGATAINYYVSTATGTETLQVSVALPATSFAWTEPVTGLVTGAAKPSSNTTQNLTVYGIYEESGGGTGGIGALPNIYDGNQFYGLASGNEIVLNTSYSRIQSGNITNPGLSAAGARMADTTTIVSKSGSYTIGPADGTVLVTGTATITLPTAAGIPGIRYTVKNAGAGTVTLATTSGQTIDGAATKVLASQAAVTSVISDGGNWQVVQDESASGSGIVPSDMGLATWTFDPGLCSGSAHAPSAGGDLLLSAVVLRHAKTVTELAFLLAGFATTPTAGQNWVILYPAAGGAALVSADCTSYLASGGTNSTGVVGVPCTATSLTAGSYILGMYFNASVLPTLGIYAGSSTVTANAGFSNFRYAQITGNHYTTSVPSLTPGSAAQLANCYWMGMG